jgi:hypothetical protein
VLLNGDVKLAMTSKIVAASLKENNENLPKQGVVFETG